MTLKLLYSSPLENQKLLYKKPHGNIGKLFGDLNPMKRPEIVEKIRKVRLGKKQSPEHIEHNRQAHIGKKLTHEHAEKARKANLGKRRTAEAIEKTRQWHLGRKRSPKTCEKIRKSQNRSEVKEKKRKLRINQIEKNYGIARPNYNLNACNFFELFDAQYDTNGRYAVYGNGEYLIKELGYFPDYINFDLKLIMEYDEEHHFDEKGNLNLKDIQSQQEIQKFYPDFEFFRIKGIKNERL